MQLQIDHIIEQILKGADQQAIVQKLSMLLQVQTARTIVLGCTEWSLFTRQLSCNKSIIDPLEITAKKIVEKSFFK